MALHPPGGVDGMKHQGKGHFMKLSDAPGTADADLRMYKSQRWNEGESFGQGDMGGPGRLIDRPEVT